MSFWKSRSAMPHLLEIVESDVYITALIVGYNNGLIRRVIPSLNLFGEGATSRACIGFYFGIFEYRNFCASSWINLNINTFLTRLYPEDKFSLGKSRAEPAS